MKRFLLNSGDYFGSFSYEKELDKLIKIAIIIKKREMSHFSTLPPEIIEIIISNLDIIALSLFIDFYECKEINWNMVHHYHFMQKRDAKLEYKVYADILSTSELIELKELLELDGTPDEISRDIPCMLYKVQLINIQKLDISVKYFDEIPKQIGNLTNLQKLDLFKNDLLSLPSEPGNLTNLKKLNLSANCLSGCYYPKFSAKISKNPLQSLGNLKSLQKLDISYNNLSTLPPEIAGMNPACCTKCC